MTNDRHLDEEIQELLDGRLDAQARAAAEAHLGECPRCRAKLEGLRWVRSQVRGAEVGVPADLARGVRLALDREDAGRRTRPWVRAVAAVLAAGLGALVIWAPWKTRDVTVQVAHDFVALRDRHLGVSFRSTDPGAIESYFREQGIEFATRVFDLAMMDYRLVGGRSHTLPGRRSALFVYRGPDGRWLVCQMFPGLLDELGPADDTRLHEGIRFKVFERDGLTLVFWQEGDVVCVLVSDSPSQQVIDLAFAKAVL